MKKALVTGANGFVGSALVRELVKNNVEVIALDRDGCNNNIPENVRFPSRQSSPILSPTVILMYSITLRG